MDAVAAAGQQRQAGSNLVWRLCLAQNPAARSNNRVCRQNDGTRVARGNHSGFFRSDPPGIGHRRFVGAGRFITLGRVDSIGHHAQPGKQIQPPGRGRGQNEIRGRDCHGAQPGRVT
jgi:hypothetical protein